jgi:hypothetical protein
MEYKILQIIPVTKPMYATFSATEGDIKTPIFCLALIEYEDGERAVKAMDQTGDNEFSFPEDSCNFIQLSY